MTDIEYLKSHGWIHVRSIRFGPRLQFVWKHPRYGDREFKGTQFAIYADQKMIDSDKS
jgi:hypothetical protein